MANELALPERLLENAKHHRDIAHDCDCAPEHTVNWQHALDDEAAAERIAWLEADAEDIRQHMRQCSELLKAGTPPADVANMLRVRAACAK